MCRYEKTDNRSGAALEVGNLMLDYLARLVNKKSRLERMKLPLWATAWLRTHQQLGGLIPLAGIVFVAHASIRNFGCIYRNKQPERKLTDMKKSH